MFKVSQEIYLNASDAANHSKVFGKYQRAPDDGVYPQDNPKIYVAPELTEVNKVDLLHFPEVAIKVAEQCRFILRKNGVRGNLEARLVSPFNKMQDLELTHLDPERSEVKFVPKEIGLYKILVKLNAVEIPQSPLKIVVEDGSESGHDHVPVLPTFKSDASKVKQRGNGLQDILLNDKNDFVIDASAAGANILFIGICGPHGQCDEVSIKHVGQNVYNVTYRVQDKGHYLIAAKWGDDHIPGSPFTLVASS